jgi:hypothetical protein
MASVQVGPGLSSNRLHAFPHSVTTPSAIPLLGEVATSEQVKTMRVFRQTRFIALQMDGA